MNSSGSSSATSRRHPLAPYSAKARTPCFAPEDEVHVGGVQFIHVGKVFLPHQDCTRRQGGLTCTRSSKAIFLPGKPPSVMPVLIEVSLSAPVWLKTPSRMTEISFRPRVSGGRTSISLRTSDRS